MTTRRRTFLQGATATSALFATSALEAGEPEPAQTPAPRSANDRIQVACIGYGIMGQLDAQTASTMPGVKITSVCDIYDGRLTKAKEVYGEDLFTTRDYREILSRKDVDAVIVATPDHWHHTIAAEAMRAGKDVYCQKPMVRLVENGAVIVKAQQETGRILQVGSQMASSVIYTKAKELIAAGAIGKVHMIESFWDRRSAQGAWQYSIPPDASPQTLDWDRFLGDAPKRPFDAIRAFRWRNYQEYGSGVAGDLFVHLFTGIHYVMNSIGPNRVVASGGLHYWKDGRDVPDLLIGLYDYPQTAAHGPFNVNIRVNLMAGGGDGSGFRFVGSHGMISLSVRGSLTLTTREPDKAPGQSASTFAKATSEAFMKEYHRMYPDPEIPVAAGGGAEQTWNLPRGYTEQNAHHLNFFNAVRSRKPVIEDAVFGLRAAGPALLSNVSYFENKMVHWDPERMVVRS